DVVTDRAFDLVVGVGDPADWLATGTHAKVLGIQLGIGVIGRNACLFPEDVFGVLGDIDLAFALDVGGAQHAFDGAVKETFGIALVALAGQSDSATDQNGELTVLFDVGFLFGPTQSLVAFGRIDVHLLDAQARVFLGGGVDDLLTFRPVRVFVGEVDSNV